MEKREKNKNIIVFGIVMAISLSVALNIGNIFGGIGTFFKILNPIILGLSRCVPFLFLRTLLSLTASLTVLTMLPLAH